MKAYQLPPAPEGFKWNLYRIGDSAKAELFSSDEIFHREGDEAPSEYVFFLNKGVPKANGSDIIYGIIGVDHDYCAATFRRVGDKFQYVVLGSRISEAYSHGCDLGDLDDDATEYADLPVQYTDDITPEFLTRLLALSRII